MVLSGVVDWTISDSSCVESLPCSVLIDCIPGDNSGDEVTEDGISIGTGDGYVGCFVFPEGSVAACECNA